MVFTRANKETILDLFQVRQSSDALSTQDIAYTPIVYGEDLILIWKESDYRNQLFPVYICTANGKSKEFLAWSSTYLKQLKPLTAFTRVIEIDELNLLKTANQTETVSAQPKHINAFIGLIIGEVLELQNQGHVKFPNSMAARSTYSHAIAMAAIHHSPYRKVDIARNYVAARRLASLPLTPPFLSGLSGIWQNFLLVIDGADRNADMLDEKLIFRPICEMMKYIAEGEDLSRTMMEDILRQKIDASAIPNVSQKVEDRVTSFEKASNLILTNKNIHPQSASFAIACMANHILPGTMKHFALLAPFSKYYPAITMWYGLCAGLTPNSDVLSYNFGLGWRINRQIMTKSPIFDYPSSDICFNEFELLLSLKAPDTAFSTDSANNLSVELVPGIQTLVSWPPRDKQDYAKHENDDGPQLDLFSYRPNSPSMHAFGKKLYELLDMYEAMSSDSIGEMNENHVNKTRSGKGKRHNK
jgi:hypothetical protein